MHPIPSLALCITLVWALSAVVPAHAQPGTVLSHQNISDSEGDFDGELDDADNFGRSVTSLGDLDGDGIGDLAVGARFDDDGGDTRGAVWILFLNADGSVKSHQKISSTEGGFTGDLDDGDRFGVSVASLGDLDGEGPSARALAVGANTDDDGGMNRGAVWILFLDTSGMVISHQKISDTEGGFTGILDNGDLFGTSVTSLDDLDGDGIGDLAVGAHQDDDGGTWRGAVWVLFLNTDGTVKSHQKISDTAGDFTGMLDDIDRFGVSVASLGDLDGDGIGDLAVGAHRDDDGSDGPCNLPTECNRGAVWVLFLNTDGTVKEYQKISDTEGNFTGELDDSDFFGFSVASLGDHDGDGIGDLAVGAHLDDDGGTNRGAVWVLFLEGVLTASLDIKPGSCPNPLNRHSNGVLPVALVGTADFDPTEVDLSTLQLSRADGVGGSVAPNEGPPGPHSVFEDVATPFDGEGGECHDLGGDGIDDLMMKFKTQDVVTALQLDDLLGGQFVSLRLTGNLLDGTPLNAEDCIWLVPPEDIEPANATVESNENGAFIEAAPLDLNFDSDGFTSFARAYVPGMVIVLTAEPASPGGYPFLRWVVDGGPQPVGSVTIEVTITDDLDLQALYDLPCAGDLDGDGHIGASDLAQLLGSWGPCPECPSDFDDDGDVDATDLAVLLGSWGPCQ